MAVVAVGTLSAADVAAFAEDGPEAALPFGLVDTPTNNSTGVTGAVPFTGWALDDVGVDEVNLCRAAVVGEVAPIDARCAGAAQIFIGAAVFVEGARPDVNAAFPSYPQSSRAGWGLMVLTNMLPDVARRLPTGGNGTYAFFVYARDTEGQSVLLGTRTMTCDNEHATLPFGTIDTPGQGGTVSGSEYVNYGWALTPNPKSIPLDGSTISVFVDGASIGNPSYNHYRSDIAGYFPGLANSNGAVGLMVLNPKTLAKGLHTISWLVTDSNGASAGIGSRYFRVVDEANRPPVANAGVDQSVTPGATVQLDGGGSSDPDNDPLTFSWALASKPPGSTAVLSNPASVTPTFVADVVGSYSARLMVNDGQASSTPSTVTITAGLTLGCGALMTGQIVAAGQVDQITFVGSAGDRVTLTLAMTNFPSFVAARATVFTPTANALVTFDANSQQQVTLPQSGTYVVQVRASNLVSTGSYALGRECLLPVSPVDATLACGGLVSRTIGALGQVDQITFSGSAGDRVTLTLAMTSFPSFVAARATVFSPSANVLVTFDANSQQHVTLPQSGTYVVQVRASNLVSTGSYALGRECLLPVNPVDATLACGGLVSRTIGALGQVDQITFSASAGDRVTLTLAMTSFPSFVAARATVFTPSANVLVTFDANSQQHVTLPEAGTYVVQVNASNLVSTGSYALGRECLLPVGAVDATLACGGLVSRTIGALGQVDQITFTGGAGDRVTLTLAMTSFPSFVAARATVFSPSASVVVTFDANSQQQVTLPQTGTYVVQVNASNLVSSGSYALGRECLLPVSAVDATLACGGLVSRTIGALGQVDQITISGSAGDGVTLTLAMTGFPSFVAARATVFSPTANALVTFDANSQQLVTLPESGTHVVQVRASNLVSSGSYTLGRTCLP